MKSKIDLGLVETEDLIVELRKRNDAVLVALVRKQSDDTEARLIDYRGGLCVCLGLAHAAQYQLKEAILNSQDTDHWG